jgi:hypothetical protein
VTFGFEVNHFGVELVDQLVDAFQVVLLESFKLLLSLENVNKLEDPPFEDIKFPEDLGLREVEVGASWQSLNLLLDLPVFLLILLVELDTVMKNLDEFIGLSRPNGHLESLLIFGIFII